MKTSDKEEAAREAHRIALEQDAAWKVWRSGHDFTSRDEILAGEQFLKGFGLSPGDGLRRYDHVTPIDGFEDHLRYLSSEATLAEARAAGTIPAYADHAARLLYENARPVPTLSEALNIFHQRSGTDDTERKVADRKREVDYVISRLGDRPIDQYSRAEANGLVDDLLGQGNRTGTVQRRINRVKAIFSLVIREEEIDARNPFEKLTIPGLGKDKVKRHPFRVSEVQKLQEACLEADDDMRWAIAMASDTGLRVSEVVGLRMQDIVVDESIPYFLIERYEGRSLKTEDTERRIPLVGAALWAAKRLKATNTAKSAFPRYWAEGELNGTVASNAFNKWIRQQGIQKTMHSFRHAFRDRLREAGAHEEIADNLGGWSNRSVGRGYGEGHSLRFLHSEMEKIVLPMWTDRDFR